MPEIMSDFAPYIYLDELYMVEGRDLELF